MDRFMEEVVVKKQRTLDEVLYMLAMVSMVIFAVVGFMSLQLLLMAFSVPSLIFTLACIGIAVFLFFYRDRLRTEYEYTFTNGDLDFAQVFNNQKRKTLGSLKMSRIDAFGKVNSGAFHRYINMPGIKRSNWFLNRGAELYFFYFKKDENKRIIICEPSEEMVSYIKLYLQRGVYQEN